MSLALSSSKLHGSHEPRLRYSTKPLSALLDVLSSAWRTGRSLHTLASRATFSPLTSSISHPKDPVWPHCALVFNRGSGGATWCEQQLLSRPGRHARAGPMLAARGTVYRHAIICGTVARITIATRPPRAAPTRHVTIRGCAPGTTGAGSQVPRVLSAKTRACGRASVPG